MRRSKTAKKQKIEKAIANKKLKKEIKIKRKKSVEKMTEWLNTPYEDQTDARKAHANKEGTR